MAMSMENIRPDTPLGATLTDGGATFRVWAPRANRVHVIGEFQGQNRWAADDDNLLTQADGYWAGYLPGVVDGDEYKFYVAGTGSEGPKRDPYARELTVHPPYPVCNCLVRDPDGYPWHDTGWHAPPFDDLVIYQMHVGTFSGPNRESRVAKFLDVIDRLDYLADLGVTALEPLPITEFASPRSLGYDGSDLYSPETDYQVQAADLEEYLTRVNALLARRGQPALTRQELSVPINQFKALVDLCHLWGIAVILDVVYNHAGFQIGGQDESLWFFDRFRGTTNNDSLYFTDRTHIGPVFALWQHQVRQFLIDNTRFFVDEYHVDGFRYDEVSVIVAENLNNGWNFCQDLTTSTRAADPTAVQVAEYWPVNPAIVRPSEQGGAGFDATWHDGLRTTVRAALGQAAGGAGAGVDLEAIARSLYPISFSAGWRAVQHVESHDEVYAGRNPRIARLADGSNPRSWYATSRSRVATGLVLTAPCIPLLFMGQEFLEDKQWSDNPGLQGGSLIWWEGLEQGTREMVDHLRFTRELIALRRSQPALTAEAINVFHVHNGNRVLAFHRWTDFGRDVVVVFNLREQTWYDYRIGLPQSGRWFEVFNSDVYQNWVNPIVAGNGAGVDAQFSGIHGLGYSAPLTIPANGFIVLAKER